MKYNCSHIPLHHPRNKRKAKKRKRKIKSKKIDKKRKSKYYIRV